ncbi:MAG: hypothetical protein ABJQ96_18310 [Crocinitomicaceae bacterium]
MGGSNNIPQLARKLLPCRSDNDNKVRYQKEFGASGNVLFGIPAGFSYTNVFDARSELGVLDGNYAYDQHSFEFGVGPVVIKGEWGTEGGNLFLGVSGGGAIGAGAIFGGEIFSGFLFD